MDEDLTTAGLVRRVRRLVPLAMAHHDIEVVRVRLAAQAFNTTFRIDARDGRRFALRVGAPLHLTTEGIAEVEAVWAAALAADTPVAPPQVIRTRTGAAAVTVGSAGVPGARTCVLFTWQEGRALHGRLHDLPLVATAGEVLAILHDHATAFDGVQADEVLRGDRVCYFRLPDRLAERDALFAEGAGWAQVAIDRLWRDRGGAAHLLHGDYYPRNLLVRHRRVVPIDFQDAMWGLEEQDLAITLVMLDHDDPSGTAATAFRRGYERRRTWPLTDPAVGERLTIARRLQIANLQFNQRPEGTSPFVEDLARDLRRLLRRDRPRSGPPTRGDAVTDPPVLTAEQIADLTRRIHAERRRTVDRIEQLGRAFDQIASAAAIAPPDDEHDPEGATIGFERAQVASLLAASRRRLEAVGDALDRLATDEAGRCRTCGAAIGIERLRARPVASTCVACAAS